MNNNDYGDEYIINYDKLTTALACFCHWILLIMLVDMDSLLCHIMLYYNILY